MLAGEDRNKRNAEDWQQVSLAFASTIAAAVQRLAGYIQGHLARHLRFGRTPFLPVWQPDDRTPASTRWAERLVSRIYDTIQSLPGARHLAPPLSVQPSRFIWSRPSLASTVMPEGSEYINVEPDFAATQFAAQNAALQATASRRTEMQRHTVSRPYADSTSQPDPRTRTSPSASRPTSPNLHRRHMELRPDFNTEPDAMGQGPHPTRAAPVGQAMPTPPPAEDTTMPRAGGESSVVPSQGGPEQPLSPLTTARPAPLAARAVDAPPGVKKVLTFSHRLLAGVADLTASRTAGQLAVSPAATDVHPPGETGADPSLTGVHVGPEATGEQVEATPAETASTASIAPHRLPAMSSRQHFTQWLHRRRYPSGEVSSPEPAYLPMEAEGQAALPELHPAGLLFDAASMVAPSAEFIFPSPPVMPPASPQEMAMQALQPVATPDLVLAQPQPPAGQQVPTSSPRSLSHIPPASATAGLHATLPAGSGRPSDGAATAPALALAPLGRPTAQGQPPTTGQETGETAGGEGTEEAAELNLERLARDVYTVLKRRLAREMESRLTVRV